MSHTMSASASTANLVAKTPAQHPATPVHTALDLTDSHSQKLLFKRYMRSHGGLAEQDSMPYSVFEVFAKDFGVFPHICRDHQQLSAVFEAVVLMPGCSNDAASHTASSSSLVIRHTINLEGFGRVLTILHNQLHSKTPKGDKFPASLKDLAQRTPQQRTALDLKSVDLVKTEPMTPISAFSSTAKQLFATPAPSTTALSTSFSGGHDIEAIVCKLEWFKNREQELLKQARDVDDEKQQLLQMMREQHQKHEHALSQQQQLYALLQDRNQTLSNTVDEAHRTKIAQQNELDHLRSALSASEKQYSECERKSSSIQHQLNEMNRENDRLMDQVSRFELDREQQRQEFEAELKTYRSNALRNQCTIEELHSKHNNLQNRYDELVLSLQQSDSSLQQCRQQVGETQLSMQKQQASHQSLTQSLKSQLQQRDERIKRLVDDNQELESKFNELQASISILQSSTQDSRQSEAEWRHQKVRAEAELEVQRLEIDRIRAELMQETEKIYSQKSDISVQLKIIEDGLKSLEQEKEAQFFAISEQNSSLFEKEQQLQEREDRLAHQIASFKSMEQSQSVQSDSTFESKLQEKLDEMRIELESDFDKEVAEQLQEIVKEKVRLEKQKTELVDRSNTVEQSIQDLQLQQSKLESDAQKLHAEQGELHSMFKELENVRQELAHERSQLDELRVSLQRSEMEPSLNINEEHSTSEHIQNSNSEDADSFANDEELLEVAQAMESLKSELGESHSRIQQLEAQLAEAVNKSTALQNEAAVAARKAEVPNEAIGNSILESNVAFSSLDLNQSTMLSSKHGKSKLPIPSDPKAADLPEGKRTNLLAIMLAFVVGVLFSFPMLRLLVGQGHGTM